MSKYVVIEQKYLLIFAIISFILGIFDLISDFGSYKEFMTVCGIFLLIYGLILLNKTRYDKVKKKDMTSFVIVLLVFGVLQIVGTVDTYNGFMLSSGVSLCILSFFVDRIIEKIDKDESEEPPPRRK